MQVVLSEEYTKQLEKQIEKVIDRVIENKIAQMKPYKRYLTRAELCKFLSIGQCTMDKLAQAGLTYAVLGNRYLFDIEEVYRILETLKK
ncbi:hypothetical protein HZY83_02435 [Gemella sp. GH3]|nr:hypothetical protein [Gemella sp. GH3.1]NYS50496.1 hypothetical protein [Gemella sp. GH3]